MSNQIVPQNEEESTSSGLAKLVHEPLSKLGLPSWIMYLLGLIGLVYILNPTLGLLELIPDNLPVIGNLDEGVAVMLLLGGILEAVENRKKRRLEKAAQTTQIEEHPENPEK